ncbi:DUF805 domain-containing protein [uncultured Akkermansia sp.]|uniref:DUF805 domain-containing protein n=1 Tax=uncultured Akkermansia sp. TaxID=512294 RepID=UPI00262E5731|nr:DUF805 domain-containing protein [uncultured Akkermansia sp.]
MSGLYEYQAIDGSPKGPVSLELLLRARNLGRLSNRTLVRKVPDGDWRPLASFIPSMTVMDDDGVPSVLTEAGTGPEDAGPGWSRRKYWMRVIKAWCSFKGRAGKGELHEVFSGVGVAWLAVAGVPSVVKCGFFPSLSSWVELVSPLLYMALAVLSVPLAATMVRRLHDVGRSGFFLVFLAVPFVGWLLLWYLFHGESRLGENKYGDPPWN